MSRLAPLFLFAFAVATAAAEPDPLPGRLFHSPEERRQLEQPPAAAPIREAAPTKLRLDGIVLRSDGVATFWINGSQHENTPSGDFSVQPGAAPGSARIVTRDRREFLLHVGESLLLPEPSR